MKNLILLLGLTIVSASSFSQNNNKNQNSGLGFLTEFPDNSKVKRLEKKGNQTSKILFNIRRYIVTNSSLYRENMSEYGLENLLLDAKKTILKYKYLEKKIEMEKGYEDLFPTVSGGYSSYYRQLVKTYNRVSANEIVYQVRVKFSTLQKHKNSSSFILDSRLNVIDSGGLLSLSISRTENFNLYAIDMFFVEVCYNSIENKIMEINSFKSGRLLDRYSNIENLNL
jgi:hypothetical protein